VPFSGSTFVPTPLDILLREDLQEPNDSRAAAGLIALPYDNSTLSIDEDNENDFYQFVVPVTGAVTLSAFFSHSLGDVDLQLQDSAGAVLAISTGVGNNETLTHTVNAGTYYARVYGAGAGSCNRYTLTASFDEALPSVNLEINGLDPESKIVPTTGMVRLTLDMEPNAYTSSAQWYWAIVYGGVAYWVTAGGVTTVAAPLVTTAPVTLTDLELLNLTLSTGNWTFVFFLYDGTNVLAVDWITASVAP
jgi:hypothetical protein